MTDYMKEVEEILERNFNDRKQNLSDAEEELLALLKRVYEEGYQEGLKQHEED